MKRILSLILTIAMMLSVIGSVAIINTDSVYARVGYDVNGDKVENTNIYQPTDNPVYYYQPPVDENGNHDYFGYPIYDDPQDIPDTDFFGKWDEIDNKWVAGPYLRYSEYEGLAKVEAAAKSGDYETAKEELLAYYKEIGHTRGDSKTYGTVTPQATTILEGMSRNIFSLNFISAMSIGAIYVPENEFSKVSVTVHSGVVSEFIGGFPQFSVEIGSGDKYWTTAEIYTKEAKDPSLRPYASAIVNGIYTEFPAIKDAMVVAGVSGDVNYGSEDIAYVQEHGCFDNIDGSMGSYDHNTKRYFVAFDTSKLKKTDSVKNMQIHFVARNIIDEETKAKFDYEGEADRSKLLWATWYKDSAWQEETLTWNTTTIMDKFYFSCHDMEGWDYITSNAPAVKGKVCAFHRDSDQSSLRTGWTNSKDERFAYTYIRQEMALINSIGCEPTVMNSLDMSTHMSGLSSAFYAMLDSKYFTAEVCAAWLKFMWQLCDWQVECYFGTSDNNWGTFASAAVYDGVAKFPEFFTHDYWYEKTLEDNTRMLGVFTLEDGLCVEQSMNYISTILNTMNTPIATMLRTGHPAPYDEELYQEVHECVQSLIFCAGPYFGGFNQADGYDPYKSYKSTYKTWYQTLFPDDENLAWIVSGGTSGKMPENPTTVYPTSYKTFMRSGWDQKSLQLSFINVSDMRRSHAHNDQLSFAMFAYGQYLLVDPGYGSDQTGDGGRVWKYNKSPVQHNVVTINDTYDYIYDGICAMTDMRGGGGGSRDFESNKYYDYQEYYNTGFSTSPLMQRSITFLKDSKFWIVSDYNVPNDPSVENVFAQHWHTYPDSNMTHDDNLIVRTNLDGPNVQVVPIESDEIDNLEWVDCFYSESSGMKVIAQKAMYTKTHTGNARFTTLIIPEDIDDNFKVESSVVMNSSGLDDSLINGAYFRITDENTSDVNYYFYYHINDDTAKPVDGVKIGDYTTDATTLVVQTDEDQKVISVFVVNGSFVKDASVGNEYLFKAKEPVTISYKKSGYFINIISSQIENAEQLKDVKLYSTDAKAVRLDGEDMKADIDDGVITLLGEYGSSNISSGGGTGGGGGGSSGGSGGAGGTTPSTPKEPEVVEPTQPTEPITPVEPTPAVMSYDDVASDDWFYDSVKYVYDNELMNGISESEFGPSSNLTRAMLVTILYRAEGEPEVSFENIPFGDIAIGSYYEEAVIWAAEKGIVSGYDANKFAPNSNITRQQMAAIMYRYAKYKGYDASVGKDTNILSYDDASDVSEYAMAAMQYAVGSGLINGKTPTTLNPSDNATRAETSAILKRFFEANK